MLEHYRQPLAPPHKFVLRMVRSGLLSLALITVTVLAGMVVFHYLENLSWLDAYLNSILIMTGVGTVGIVNTSAGKILTGIYSLVSTLVFFAVLAIVITPLLHRLLHKFHLDLERKN